MNSRFCLCLLLLMASLGLSAISVSITPNPKVTQAQQDFTVQVTLDTPTVIRGCTVWFEYDPDKIEYQGAEIGELLSGFDLYWFLSARESPTRIRVPCIIMGAELYVTGPGDMLNLNFTALAGDFSSIDIVNIQLYDVIGYEIPGVEAFDGDVIIGEGAAYGKIKCWLQGAYSGGAMLTTQNAAIPLNSPYPTAPACVDSIPGDVVDWMLLELRSVHIGQPVGSYSLFLDSGGYLRTPGKPYLILMNSSPGPYYLVLRHRNHMAIMSATAQTLSSSGSPAVFDLTNIANIYGNGGMVEVEEGIHAMAAGDADANGKINTVDRNSHWREQTGLNGYLSADFNLDAYVSTVDLNDFWRANSSLLGTTPPRRSNFQGTIEFTLSPEVIRVNGESFLSLDILASSPDPNQRIGSGMVQLNYNPALFGENVKSSGNVAVTHGSLINAFPFPYYNLIMNDNSPSRLAITFEYLMPAGLGGLLTSTPQQLLNVSLRLLDTGFPCGFSFQQNLMVNQQYLDDNHTRFAQVLATDTDNTLIPSQPAGLCLSLQGNNLQLNWQEANGCTYSVYSAQDPNAEDWQMEASGLTDPFWSIPIQSNRMFFRVTASGYPDTK